MALGAESFKQMNIKALKRKCLFYSNLFLQISQTKRIIFIKGWWGIFLQIMMMIQYWHDVTLSSGLSLSPGFSWFFTKSLKNLLKIANIMIDKVMVSEYKNWGFDNEGTHSHLTSHLAAFEISIILFWTLNGPRFDRISRF